MSLFVLDLSSSPGYCYQFVVSLNLNLIMGLMYLGVKISYYYINPFTLVSLKLWNLFCQMWKLQLLLLICLFLLSIWLVRFCFFFFQPFIFSLCISLDILLDFVCIFWLGDLVDLNLGLLPFVINWVFCPFVDKNSSLC